MHPIQMTMTDPKTASDPSVRCKKFKSPFIELFNMLQILYSICFFSKSVSVGISQYIMDFKIEVESRFYIFFFAFGVTKK